jgi:dTDP-4-amino-4,6-dideoxygalactose transaminase
MAKLAIEGGPKAVSEPTGKPEPKIGVDEFMALAERFGFTEDALRRIRGAVSDADLIRPGPFFARYGSVFPEGPAGEKFEALAREKFGVEYARGVSSGTAALHSAFVAVGVGPGAEVIVPAIGFLATAAAVAHSGGTPVFCDVDESLHMDPVRIEPLITERTVAVAPTHVMGGICDVGGVVEVAHKHGLKVVEDCAQSPGGRYRGRYVGTIGDIGCFSISSYKIIGAGEAGLVLTDDERLFERASQLAECGGLWRPNRFAPPRYEGELFVGTNYRMSELEAAVDVVQLGKLDEVVRRYHGVKMRILRQLQRFREIVPQRLNDVEGEVGQMLRFFPATVELGQKIAAALAAEGVNVGFRGRDSGPDWHHYATMFPLAAGAGSDARRGRRGDCPVADDLWEREVMVSLGQWASPEDCDNIAAAINKVLSAYCTVDAGARGWC